MSDIQATTRSVRDLFKDQFSIGAYQREYEWEDDHAKAMVKDLLNAFRPRVGALGSKEYFLGPIITTSRRGVSQLIDGQQRLTTLAIILLCLTRRVKEASAGGFSGFTSSFDTRLKLGAYSKVFSEVRRQRALTALEVSGEVATPESDLEAAINARFMTVSDELQSRLEQSDVSIFFDWLLDKVTFADIRAGESYDPFSLFDAMNSRGLGLKGMAQFRSFVNRKFGDDRERRTIAMDKFQETLESIQTQGPGADNDFVSSWLGARCVDVTESVPARPTDARRVLSRSVLNDIFRNGPFFAIEKADSIRELGLGDPGEFIENHWCTFGEVFNDIRQARKTFNPALEGMYFIEQVNFDFDLYDELLLLAACKPGSDENETRVKIAAQFMENIAARWAWTYRTKGITARSQDRLKFLLARAATDIRGKSNADMARALALLQRQLKVEFTQETELSHPLTGTSPVIHAILARLAAFLDEINGTPGTYGKYGKRADGADSYEVEHFLPKSMTNNGAESGHGIKKPDEYRKLRQRIGAITVIPDALNRQLSGSPLAIKRGHYNSHDTVTLLTKSLNGGSALPKPVAQWLGSRGIDFPTVQLLTKESIAARQKALLKLAEEVWSEDRILARAGISPANSQAA